MKRSQVGKSSLPRKQRKSMYQNPQHRRYKLMSVHLDDKLMAKYPGVWSVEVRKGDTVKIIKGAFKGHEGKVADLNYRDYRVMVEGATIVKKDGKHVARKFAPNALVITKLDLTDKKRRERLERISKKKVEEGEEE